MVFVRIKNIKGSNYAYLVENYWNGKSSRQKVTQYLGRVLEFPIKQNAPVPDMSRDYKVCVKEIIAWHLIRIGFKRTGDILSRGKTSFDLISLEFLDGQKPIRCVLKSADGYLCKITAKEILEFHPSGSDEEVGLSLAKAVVNAGIELPPELFVALFEKANAPRQRSRNILQEMGIKNKKAAITY